MGHKDLTLVYDGGTSDLEASNDNGREVRSAKVAIEVDLILANGTGLRGTVFLGADQRISDLLNDGRAFLPFQDLGQTVRLIAKQAIFEVKPRSKPG